MTSHENDIINYTNAPLPDIWCDRISTTSKINDFTVNRDWTTVPMPSTLAYTFDCKKVHQSGISTWPINKTLSTNGRRLVLDNWGQGHLYNDGRVKNLLNSFLPAELSRAKAAKPTGQPYRWQLSIYVERHREFEDSYKPRCGGHYVLPECSLRELECFMTYALASDVDDFVNRLEAALFSTGIEVQKIWDAKDPKNKFERFTKWKVSVTNRNGKKLKTFFKFYVKDGAMRLEMRLENVGLLDDAGMGQKAEMELCVYADLLADFLLKVHAHLNYAPPVVDVDLLWKALAKTFRSVKGQDRYRKLVSETAATGYYQRTNIKDKSLRLTPYAMKQLIMSGLYESQPVAALSMSKSKSGKSKATLVKLRGGGQWQAAAHRLISGAKSRKPKPTKPHDCPTSTVTVPNGSIILPVTGGIRPTTASIQKWLRQQFGGQFQIKQLSNIKYNKRPPKKIANQSLKFSLPFGGVNKLPLKIPSQE